MSLVIDDSTTRATSAAFGQMSARNTSVPSGSVPIASFSGSQSIVPASA